MYALSLLYCVWRLYYILLNLGLIFSSYDSSSSPKVKAAVGAEDAIYLFFDFAIYKHM